MAASRPVRPAAADRATPLELFFDLVYVFAFTQVTHLMADGESIEGVLGGLAVLGILWWSWASHAWLANQRAADGGVVRVGIVIAIMIVLVLSVAIPGVYPTAGESTFGALLFAIGFVVLSVAYTAVNLVLAREDSALRRQVVRTMGITIVPVAAALIGGAILGGERQLVLWLAAVVIEGATVYFTSRGGHWRLPSAVHYAERHGLVVILALGESIISIGLAAAHSPLTPYVVVSALAAVSVALGMWWMYFARVAGDAERNIEALVGERRAATATVGTYLHFGIVTGILLVSLGLSSLVERVGGEHSHILFSAVTLAIGAALFSTSTALYSLSTRPKRTSELLSAASEAER